MDITVPGPSRRSSPQHPLSYPTSPTSHKQALPDTRPALQRATSATERQVAESSKSGSEWGSTKGSIDRLRKNWVDDGSSEVEVLIHTVKSDESLAGIALLYGIDLATLRKVNKLWTSDSMHTRAHLYVPLGACRLSKAKGLLVRGQGEGQVILLSKQKDKGKEKVVDELEQGVDRSHKAKSREAGLFDKDAVQEFMPSTNIAYSPPHGTSIPLPNEPGQADSPSPEQTSPRILDIVRIPSSQLQFFPKRKPPDTPRASTESVHQKERDGLKAVSPRASSTCEQPKGSSVMPNLSALPPLFSSSLGSSLRRPKSSTVVKLRPPQPIKPLQTSSVLANRLSAFFAVPPPPTDISMVAQPGFHVRSSSERDLSRPSINSVASDITATSGGAMSIPAFRRHSMTNSFSWQKQEEMELVTRVQEYAGLGLGLSGLTNGTNCAKRSLLQAKKTEKSE
ncbi:hypothetical protein L204_101869 [Cryptococcus depauperatus]|nr:hypothetical protein L204_05519 [Cryptococcus depauperatus CBS 7855]